MHTFAGTETEGPLSSRFSQSGNRPCGAGTFSSQKGPRTSTFSPSAVWIYDSVVHNAYNIAMELKARGWTMPKAHYYQNEVLVQDAFPSPQASDGATTWDLKVLAIFDGRRKLGEV